MDDRTHHVVPEGLEEFQRRFSATLRTPLRRDTGALEADLASYDADLVARVVDRLPAARERLAVYHRQYWFRLFNALQTELPLTASLLGLWDFNRIAELYLRAQAPRGPDLGCLADGFDDWIVAEAPATSLPRAALRQAVAVDLAFAAIWRAPSQPAWRPSPSDAPRLPRARLHLRSTVRLVHEDWPFVGLRAALQKPAERALAMGTRQSRTWVVLRHDGPADHAIGHLEIQAWQARLLRTCTESSLEYALGSAAKARIRPRDVQQWFERTVRLGLWGAATFAETP